MDGEYYGSPSVYDVEDAELGQWMIQAQALPSVIMPTSVSGAGGFSDPIPSGAAPSSSNGWSLNEFLTGIKTATSTVTDIARTAAGIQTAKDEFSLKRLQANVANDISRATLGTQRDIALANAGVQSYQAKLANEQARQAFANATEWNAVTARVAGVSWYEWLTLGAAGIGIWFAWKTYGKRGKR